MSKITDLRKDLEKSIEKVVTPIEFKAIMGRADGEVKYSQNEVYVTLMNGDVITIYNDRLPRIAYRKIIIGYLDNDPSLLQVIRFDNVYATRPTAMIVNHKESHAWYAHDPVDISAQQILPLLPRAIGGLSVRVYGGQYKLDSLYHVLPTTDFDMSAEVPTTGAEWVNAEIDAGGVVTYNHGDNKAARELLLPEDIPVTSATKKLLYSAKMYVGQSQIIQTRLGSDIFDPRFTGVSSGGLATMIEWADILSVPTEFNPDIDVTDLIYPRKWLKFAAPTVDDDVTTGYSKSDIWMDQASGDAYICIDNADGAADWLRVGSGSGDYCFYVDGHLVAATNAPNAFIVTKDLKITACYIYCKNPGTAGSTIVDINKNGTTIYTTTANRPTLAYNDADGWASSVPDILTFAAGDVISLDIDQAATGAADLAVALYVIGAGSGGGTFNLTVTDGVAAVANVGQITVENATVTDMTGGEVKITVREHEYILVRDEKTSGTAGGTFTSGAWQTRDLTALVFDGGGICSLSSNQITLLAGTYDCSISAPAFRAGEHKAVLYNVTDATEQLIGTSEYTEAGHYDSVVRSLIVGRFTIAATKIFEVRHKCNSTFASIGFGIPVSFGVPEIYTIVELRRVAL